jgi:hypothetical protein
VARSAGEVSRFRILDELVLDVAAGQVEDITWTAL